MTAQQQRAVEAFRSRSYYGMGDTTQQGDAATVSQSLYHSAALATLVGGPLAGAIVSAAGALAQIVSLFGPNPNNTLTTGWVNQIEADVMKPNLAAWQALPASGKYQTLQATALNTFTTAWAQLLQLCDNPSLGSAGINCIADRQRGGKWDWWAYYYDPIKNDPEVIPDPVASAVSSVTGAVSSSVDSAVSSISTATGLSPLWLGVGLVAAALFLVSD